MITYSAFKPVEWYEVMPRYAKLYYFLGWFTFWGGLTMGLMWWWMG